MRSRPFFVLLLVVALATSATAAETPMLINYQGRLLDSSGNPITGIQDINFSIFDDSTLSNLLWEETHLDVIITEGEFSLQLGSITPLTADIFISPDIFVSNVGQIATNSLTRIQTRLLRIGVGKLGVIEPILPPIQLVSVPYAVASSRVAGDIFTNSDGLFMINPATGDTTIMMTRDLGTGLPTGKRTHIVPGGAFLVDSSGDTTISLRSGIGSGLPTGKRTHIVPGGSFLVDSSGDTTISFNARLAEGQIKKRPPADGSDGARSTQISAGGTFMVDSFFDIAYRIEFNTTDSGSESSMSSSGPLGSNSMTQRASHDIAMNAIRNTRAISPSGADTTEIDESVNTNGVSMFLRRDNDSDGDGLLDFFIDRDGVSLSMNKGELIDAMASGPVSKVSIVTDTSKAQMTLSKADAGNALNAFASSTSAGLVIIDSTLNDSAIIDLQIDNGRPHLRMAEDRPNAVGSTSKFEFTVLPDRIELAKTDAGGGSGSRCTLDNDKFVRERIGSSDTTFVLNFADKVMSLRTPSGVGVISSRVEIRDLNVDGTLDLRVDGDIGIGTSTPSEKLQVIGNICATGTIGVCSDVRYKTEIKTLPNAMDKIGQLRGVEFDWRTDQFPDKQFSESRQVGFIAQEIIKVLPSVVTLGSDGYYSVDYGKLTPLLVEAVKSQQSTIESQKSRITNLEARLAKLETLVNKMAELSSISNNSYAVKAEK